MFQWLTDVIQSIVTNPLSVAILPILVTIYLTYYVTKKNIRNDRKNEINQKSFELVYLPLNRRFRDLPSYNLSQTDAKKLYLQIHTLYEKHIIYCNPIINRLLEELKKKNNNGKSTNDVIIRLHSHIRDTYVNLRHKLNYPCISCIDSIKYKSFGLIALYFGLILVALIYILFSIIALTTYYNLDSKFTDIITYSTVILIFIFLLLVISYIGYLLMDLFFKLVIKKWRQSTFIKRLFKH